MRKLIFACTLGLLFFVAPRANAALFNVDLSTLPTVPGSGGGVTLPYCFHGACATASETPIFLLSSLGLPSDATVNFGTIDYSSIGFCGPHVCGSANPFYFVAFNGQPLPGANGFSGTPGDCTNVPLVCSLFVLPTQTAPLVFNLNGLTSIQIEFSNPGSIVAPSVPEPSTWAMLLIGFAGTGFAAYRRRKQTLRVAWS
jgi:hypothetical protein